MNINSQPTRAYLSGNILLLGLYISQYMCALLFKSIMKKNTSLKLMNKNVFCSMHPLENPWSSWKNMFPSSKFEKKMHPLESLWSLLKKLLQSLKFEKNAPLENPLSWWTKCSLPWKASSPLLNNEWSINKDVRLYTK